MKFYFQSPLGQINCTLLCIVKPDLSSLRLDRYFETIMNSGRSISTYLLKFLFCRRQYVLTLIVFLCCVSLVILGVFQSYLHTNKEILDGVLTKHINHERQGMASNDHNIVGFHEDLYKDREQPGDVAKTVQSRKLKEKRKQNVISRNNGGFRDGNVFNNIHIQDGVEKHLSYQDNRQIFPQELNDGYKADDSDVIADGVNDDKTLIKKPDNYDGEGNGKQQEHGNLKYGIGDNFDNTKREVSLGDHEQQYLVDKLSNLLAKFDEKGVDTNLNKRLIADTAAEYNMNLHKFEPQMYPQIMDIQQLLVNFRVNGVLPEDSINPWIYEATISPSQKCFHNRTSAAEILLLYIVKTSPDNFEKRKTLRQTWADERRFPNMRTVFSIGIPRQSSTMMKLKLEALKYRDILLMDYMDTYYNLTLKTISGINWAVTYCHGAKFVVSVDDDMYVATDFLIKYLEDLPPAQVERLYLGHVYKNTNPIRYSTSNAYVEKWIISEEEYQFSTYPDYVFGGFIVMSMQTVVEMYLIIPYTKMIQMEDVYLGIVASRLGIVPIDTHLVDEYITYSNTEKFKTLIASHYYKTAHMLRKAWECHLSSIENNVEKAVFCLYLKNELEVLRNQVKRILYWIELSDRAV